METIISLTTIPERITLMEKTIKSLINQDLPNYKVVVHIPRKALRSKSKVDIKIPPFLMSDKIDVVFWDEDLGSIMKLFYTLRDNPKSNVITADDDVYYPTNWASTLVNFYNNYKFNVPICFRGRNFIDTTLDYKKTYVVNCNIVKKPTKVDIITGTWGVLYRKDMFHPDFFNFKVGLFSRIDDIWITGMLWKNKKKGVVIPYKNKITPTNIANINSLWEGNANGINNNKGINEFKKYYFK